MHPRSLRPSLTPPPAPPIDTSINDRVSNENHQPFATLVSVARRPNTAKRSCADHYAFSISKHDESLERIRIGKELKTPRAEPNRLEPDP